MKVSLYIEQAAFIMLPLCFLFFLIIDKSNYQISTPVDLFLLCFVYSISCLFKADHR